MSSRRQVVYCANSLGSSESALLEVTAVFCGVVVATGIALIVRSTALEAPAHKRSLISRTRSTFVFSHQPLRISGQSCRRSSAISWSVVFPFRSGRR